MQTRTMNPEQQRAFPAIALYAAFADGAKHEREREQIRRYRDDEYTGKRRKSFLCDLFDLFD